MEKRKVKIIILFISWIILTAIYVYGSSNITVNTAELSKSSLTKTTFNGLLKGEKVEGSFKVGENYLGQISVRFYNYDRINGDEVVFRMKVKGENAWLYQNTYKTDQFQPNDLFPFGFPSVFDSKGKVYEFEIESLKGKPDDSVTLSSGEPIVTATYQYPKKLLLTKPGILADFLKGKVLNIEFNFDLFFSILTYIVTTTLLVFFIFLGLSQASSKKLRALGKSSLVLCFALVGLLVSALLYYLSLLNLSETVSIGSFFLLILGTVLIIIEGKRKDL